MNKIRHRLVGLTGRIGSGKTAAAQILGRHGFRRLAFADPLKRMLQVLLSAGHPTVLPLPDKDSKPAMLGGKTVRQALQSLGTEWGRGMVSKDLWTDCARQAIAINVDNDGCVVIDDVRFDNEAQMIRDAGGVIIEISRSGVPVDTHSSENGVYPDLIDKVILNDGTLLELSDQLDSIILG